MSTNNEIRLLAMQAIDEDSALDEQRHVDFEAALEMAYRNKYGHQLQDAAFLLSLLVKRDVSTLKRDIEKTLGDPDINEDTQLELPLPFPKLALVKVLTDDGGEALMHGRDATLEQVRAQVQRTVRTTKAKATKAKNQSEKIELLRDEVVSQGVDPAELGYIDAVVLYGRSALEHRSTALESSSA